MSTSKLLVRILAVGIIQTVIFLTWTSPSIRQAYRLISTEFDGPPTSSHHQNFLPKVLAIYFPQFHADPLNDRLWGANFSDWNNLLAAPAKNKDGFAVPRPLPYKPEIPAHLMGENNVGLGYYDLRSVDIRKRQSELAKLYGIDGFIHHHYWFYDPNYNGPTLHAPLINMLRDGYPDLPFFLNWCAVSWINVWMGRAKWQSRSETINMNKAITLQQQYFNASDAQIRDHYDWLKQFFHHKNYIKVGGAPVFFSYQSRTEMMPILNRLRELAIEDGFPNLYLIIGRGAAPTHLHDRSELTPGMITQMRRKDQPVESFPVEVYNQTMVYPYPAEYINKALAIPNWCKNREKIPPFPDGRNKPEINGIPITFDNTPRREFANANLWNVGPVHEVVERFRTSLKSAITFDACCWHPSHRSDHKQERYVVINAWNEWGEGMALEPSDVYGTQFLEVVKDVKLEVMSLLERNGGLTDDGRCMFVDGDEKVWNFMNDTVEIEPVEQ